MLNQYIRVVNIPNISVEHPATWEQLCDVSPELTNIRDDAKLILGGKPQDRWFWQHYESLKRRLKSCVGMYAHPGLPDYCLTTDAYDLAYREIFGRVV